MDNRIARAWHTFQDAWKMVTTTMRLEQSDDTSDKYTVEMTLDGAVIERATVSVVHLERPGQIDTVIVRFENNVPRLETDDTLPQNMHRLEYRFASLYEQGRMTQLRDALATEGIVFTHMTIYNGPQQ